MIRFALCLGLMMSHAALAAGPTSQPTTQPDGPVIAEGTVFVDANGNGVRDVDEKSLPGVRVSDAVSRVVITDGDGVYRLPLTPGQSEFVSITLPGDYEAVGTFYRRLAAAPGGEKMKADFALKPSPDSPRFRFIVFSDPHILEKRDRALLVADLLENCAAIQPRFAINAGDITHKGGIESYQFYVDAKGKATYPVFDVTGNHDCNENFTRLLGPRHYSFERGGIHFMVIDSGRPRWDWVAADLAATPAGRKLIVFNHEGLGRLGLGTLAPRQGDLLAIIHGHGHLWVKGAVRGVPHYQVDQLGYFVGFAVAEVRDGQVTIAQVKLGTELIADRDARNRRWDEIRRQFPPIPRGRLTPRLRRDPGGPEAP